MASMATISFGPDEHRGLLEEYRRLKSEYVQEIQRAMDRLEHGSLLAWLIGFVRTDLTTLSLGDLSNLRYEIVFLSVYLAGFRFNFSDVARISALQAFLGDFVAEKLDLEFNLPIEKVKKRTNLEVSVVGTWGFVNEEPHKPSSLRDVWDYINLPSTKVIADLQTVTQKNLDDFINDGLANILIVDPEKFNPNEPIGFGISTSKILVGGETFGYIQYSAVSPLQLWGLILIPSLADHAHQLKRCSSCDSIFLAIRKTQIFCSPNCQWKTSAAKHRATPPNRLGKRGRPPGTGKKKTKKK